MFKFIALFFIPVTCFAYPQFASFGYRSCLVCHYNPMGNGPLNDYGRAVSASAISSRELYSKTTKDSEIAEKSSFFFGAFNKNTWLVPSIDYRGIQIESAVNKDDGTSRFINMQGSISLALQNKDRSLIAVADVGMPRRLFQGEKVVFALESITLDIVLNQISEFIRDSWI